MKKFRFLDWKVYKDAQALFGIVMDIVQNLPQEYRYAVGNQLIRSALSVVLNIAEGCVKSSDKEMNRYFEIALGSLSETLAAVDTLRFVGKAKDDDWSVVFQKVDDIGCQLGGFKKKLDK